MTTGMRAGGGATEASAPAAATDASQPRFWALYGSAFARPRRALDRLVAARARVRYGAYAVAITAATYQLVYLFLAHNGGRPAVFRPWLAIPAEEYYRYNAWFIVPSILLAWVAASGFTQLAARALGGAGSFEETLAALGLGLSISSWWTGLHDLVTTFLGWVRVIDQRAYEDAMNTPTPFRTLIWTLMTGYAIWFFVTFAKGVGAAHRLRAAPAAVAGAAGVVVYQLVFVIFNR
jgi:hypothetical protein